MRSGHHQFCPRNPGRPDPISQPRLDGVAMKSVLAVALCSLALAGCSGPQQAQPAPVAAASAVSNGELSELTVGIHRDRALAVREALDARLREIGQAVLRNLVPARQAGRESYLVWGDITGNRVTPVDSQGHQLSWGTHELVPDVPVVPMPPIET